MFKNWITFCLKCSEIGLVKGVVMDGNLMVTMVMAMIMLEIKKSL